MVDGWQRIGHLPSAIDHRQECPLQFEVNNQPYFLNYIPEQGRWLLFNPTRLGVEEVVAVVNDDEPLVLPDEVEVESDPEAVN